MEITHRQRIEAVISGSKPDRIPVAFWRHFPVDDQNPQRLASAAKHFQDTYDLDIIKVSPPSSFCLKDWGIKDEWIGNIEGTRDYIQTSLIPVKELNKLGVLDPTQGSLGQQLRCLSILSDDYYPQTPIIQTIFSPLSQMKNLIGKQNLIHAIRLHPRQLKQGLETITESIIGFMQACNSINIDGFFFAVQHASADVMSKIEFQEFGKPYDERLFEYFSKYWLNMLHIHGNNIYFDMMLDYPMEIMNWHDRDTFPSLHIAKGKTNKILCGGISRKRSLVTGNDTAITNEVKNAIEQTDGINFILGTGCVLPIITPFGNIHSAIQAARMIR